MKTSLLFSILVLLTKPSLTLAFNDTQSNFTPKTESHYSIYLVRHAEKHKTKDNPSLTLCGQQRAQQLATILSNIDIKKVYSTKYQRTLLTAKPIARQKNLSIEHYQPNKLSLFALKLKDKKENALVVGHSNTTPKLAALLSGFDVEKLSELEYQELYQIQFIDEKRILTRLKQPLNCL